MSSLKFDGACHSLQLIDQQGNLVGDWVAYNNVDISAKLRFIPNGTYSFIDTQRPYPHKPDPNGPYGSYGILRFNVPHHAGIGVHSGRSASKRLPGPQHPTMGCIRTSDQAMHAISELIAEDPLTSIQINNNSDYRSIQATALFSTTTMKGLAWA
ncbi:hypothetical protein NQT62_10080 [Limnobacter humi]|uniref:L,D-TPase catalytic domain-containing protein n=1 Tax=Limnobacter humi TaxID=1778671 RepID=A0ABT1WGY2_9BURK|nr:L,D-transpeptidase family protein [Limnobacter humi]MCQ8896779.1 hypothetical protein [Limnobacter humi]